jgi:ABC-2 type transport system permease protein
MKKLFIIGFKDLKLVFRDKAALIFMLLAPFLLTLGMGFVTGRFTSSSNSGISNIPVILVNKDEGQLGQALVNVFRSSQLAELVTPIQVADDGTARKQIDENKGAAAVSIPAGFTDSIIPKNQVIPLTEVQIEIYTNPTSPTSVGVIKTIVDEFISQVEVGRVSAEVVVTQLLAHQLILPQMAIQVAQEIGAQGAQGATTNEAISLRTISNTGQDVQFDILGYMAPGMALMFLMFTVSNGGRSLLTERIQGTLPRLLVSPTNSSQVLGGKIFGIFLTGTAQMLILIIASSLLFQLKWGNPLAVLVLVLASVLGAVGWGLLITSIVKTPGQISAIGTAMMLTFGILGGSFVNTDILPEWLRILGLITPNSWGLSGFQTLAMGGGLPDILKPITGLVIMGVFLFSISVFLFNRSGITKG